MCNNYRLRVSRTLALATSFFFMSKRSSEPTKTHQNAKFQSPCPPARRLAPSWWRRREFGRRAPPGCRHSTTLQTPVTESTLRGRRVRVAFLGGFPFERFSAYAASLTHESV